MFSLFLIYCLETLIYCLEWFGVFFYWTLKFVAGDSVFLPTIVSFIEMFRFYKVTGYFSFEASIYILYGSTYVFFLAISSFVLMSSASSSLSMVTLTVFLLAALGSMSSLAWISYFVRFSLPFFSYFTRSAYLKIYEKVPECIHGILGRWNVRRNVTNHYSFTKSNKRVLEDHCQLAASEWSMPFSLIQGSDTLLEG